jgi:hypothetical protein
VWLGHFVATGQLALTHYVAHVVVGMGLLQTPGSTGMGDAPGDQIKATGLDQPTAQPLAAWCENPAFVA